MPRTTTSPVGRIVSFFRTADLPTATLVLALCWDAVGERQQKSAQAKARATTPTPATSRTPVVTRAKKKKKAGKPSTTPANEAVTT